MYGGGSRLRRHVIKLCGKILFFIRGRLRLIDKGAAVLGCKFLGLSTRAQVVNYLN